VDVKGFFILPSELFENVRQKAADDENLNETLERVFRNIEASAQGTGSEDDFKGLFDDIDVNSNKLGGTVAQRNGRLAKLLNAIGDLKLGTFGENTIDVFGDAYELMKGPQWNWVMLTVKANIALVTLQIHEVFCQMVRTP